MRAIHWLRSKQEQQELSYWLSIVVFNRKDKSFSNRMYMIYLLIFFSIWFFTLFIMIADSAAFIFRLINPVTPEAAAPALMTLIFALWSIVSFWQASRVCPVTFSENDAHILCQTPANPIHVVIRWFLMPWIKNGIIIWAAAIILGFTTAEVLFPSGINAAQIFDYIPFGLRPLLAVIPIHLGLFFLNWAIGILRLQKDIQRNWLPWIVIPISIIVFSLLTIFAFNPTINLPSGLQDFSSFLLEPLHSCFDINSDLSSMFIVLFFPVVMFGFMIFTSRYFHLSRAAQETREKEKINTATNYGFNAYAENLKSKKRLGIRKKPSFLPAVSGPTALIWKNIIQSFRTIKIQQLFTGLMIISLMTAITLIPDFFSKLLILAYWVINAGQITTTRFRDDLSKWAIFRQLPFSPSQIFVFELLPPYLVLLGLSLTGFFIGSVLSSSIQISLLLILPFLCASLVFSAAFDISRRSQRNLLLNGYVPGSSLGGFFLGIGFAAIPFLLQSSIAGIFGISISFLISIASCILLYFVSIRSYKKIQ